MDREEALARSQSGEKPGGGYYTSSQRIQLRNFGLGRITRLSREVITGKSSSGGLGRGGAIVPTTRLVDPGALAPPPAPPPVDPQLITSLQKQIGDLVKKNNEQDLAKRNLLETLSKEFDFIKVSVTDLGNNLKLIRNNFLSDERLETLSTQKEEAERKQAAQEDYRVGKEGLIEKKIMSALMAPINEISSKIQLTLANVLRFFGILFTGWLIDKVIEGFKANAEGNNKKLNDIKNTILKNLGIAAAVLIGLNIGFFKIAATIGKLAFTVGRFLLSNTLRVLFSGLGSLAKSLATGGVAAIAKPAAIVAGAGLAASGAGEGIFQATREGGLADKISGSLREKGTEVGGIGGNVLKGAAGLVDFSKEASKRTGTALDIIGAPFRGIADAATRPFLSEEQKKQQDENKAKLDTRIRESIRSDLNTIDILGVIPDQKGGFGNIYGNTQAKDKMISGMYPSTTPKTTKPSASTPTTSSTPSKPITSTPTSTQSSAASPPKTEGTIQSPTISPTQPIVQNNYTQNNTSGNVSVANNITPLDDYRKKFNQTLVGSSPSSTKVEPAAQPKQNAIPNPPTPPVVEPSKPINMSSVLEETNNITNTSQSTTSVNRETNVENTRINPQTSIMPMEVDYTMNLGSITGKKEKISPNYNLGEGDSEGLPGIYSSEFIFAGQPSDEGESDENISSISPAQTSRMPSKTPSIGPAPKSQPNVIYASSRKQQPNQGGASLKTGAASDVPNIPTSNPDNFYLLYSQVNYNVVI